MLLLLVLLPLLRLPHLSSWVTHPLLLHLHLLLLLLLVLELVPLLGILHSCLLCLGLQSCDDFANHLDVILFRLAVTEGLVFQALGIVLWIDTLLPTLLQIHYNCNVRLCYSHLYYIPSLMTHYLLIVLNKFYRL